jgi:hypothetical protein
MKQESLKLAGRVVSVNAADQSVLIESTESPNRFRVYANNKLFKRIDHTLARSWFNGGKSREITGTFCIQGRVLLHFVLPFPSRLDIARAFGAVRYSPECPK